MNILLLAFALPVATILLAIVLQKVLNSPLLVAATFFAVLLIVTYAVFDSSFLVFAILYTILAYVTAILARLVCRIITRFNLGSDSENSCGCGCNNGNGGRNACGCANLQDAGALNADLQSANVRVSSNGTNSQPIVLLTSPAQTTNCRRRVTR